LQTLITGGHDLTEKGFLILNIFGNDWLVKNILITQNPKIIHVTLHGDI
jgi:hypothetical protein